MYKKFNDPISGNLSSISKVLENEILSIPLDPANTDYQEYLRWLEEGNTPLPADEPPTE